MQNEMVFLQPIVMKKWEYGIKVCSRNKALFPDRSIKTNSLKLWKVTIFYKTSCVCS